MEILVLYEILFFNNIMIKTVLPRIAIELITIDDVKLNISP